MTAFLVVVIGAGPAGSLAALKSARAGMKTLLIERDSFPRAKLCGGCLARAGVELLARHGLDTLPSISTAPRIARLILRTEGRKGGREAEFVIPEYRVLDRACFDQELVEAAVGAGVCFQDRATARVHMDGSVEVQDHRGVRMQLHPRVVLVADGLKGNSLREHPAFGWHVAPRSRVGIGSIMGSMPVCCSVGTVTMLHGKAGYAGVAPLTDGRAVVAAAVDPAWLSANRSGSPLAVLLEELGLGHPGSSREFSLSTQRGMPALTRRRDAVEAGGRIFVLGDAAGYVEPFTGEGMTWALESAERVVGHAVDAVAGRYVEGGWTACLHRGRLRRRLLCHASAGLLRRPRLTRAVVSLCGARPAVAGLLSRAVHSLQSRPTHTIGHT